LLGGIGKNEGLAQGSPPPMESYPLNQDREELGIGHAWCVHAVNTEMVPFWGTISSLAGLFKRNEDRALRRDSSADW